MSEPTVAIPNEVGWAYGRLDEMCSVVSRGKAPTYVERSAVLAIGQRCVTNAGFDASRARPHSSGAIQGALEPAVDDVLINSTGTGTIGRSCVFDAPGRFVVDGHVTVLRLWPDIGVARWLCELFRTPWGQTYLETQCYSGSTNQVELSRSKLAATRLPIPPLQEQRQIAEILDTIDEAIRKTEAILAKLKQVKQGLLHDLLTCGIDDNGELRDPERHPEQFKDSPHGRIPRGWEVLPLGCVLERIDAGKSPSCPDRPAKGDEWGVLKVSSVRPTGFQARENKAIENQSLVNPEYEVLDGDLLISRANTYELVGLTCLVEMPPPRLLLCDKTLRLRTSTAADRRFLFYSTQMPYVRAQIEIHATGSSGSMKNIGQEAIRGLQTRLPQPQEQRHIATILQTHDQRVRCEEAEHKKLRNLKQGLMEDLLTGRVRVTPLLEELAQ